jgi:hypothetical protein
MEWAENDERVPKPCRKLGEEKKDLEDGLK